MTQVAALSIVAVTVGLSLGRPRLGKVRIHHGGAALIGAALTLLFGILPAGLLIDAARFLAAPVATIVCLMVMTQVAEHAGLFERLGGALARGAAGSGPRLFACIFASGALVGTFFTNDAAVLIFTPIVFALVEKIGPDWRPEQKLPFYFAVLYVANLVGALVIANPINLVVAGLLGISFAAFATSMALPALVSAVVSFAGLWLYFRRDLPPSFRLAPPADSAPAGRPRWLQPACAAVLLLTLAGFFAEGATGIPTVAVAAAGALVLVLLHRQLGGGQVAPLVRGVSWDVLVFMAGMFVVGLGLRQAGLTQLLGAAIADGSGHLPAAMRFICGTLAAVASALINNHPTADLMAFTIQDLALPAAQKHQLGFAALIGGDLGPKMLPIGSLAALIWFRLLRDRGVEVPYALYIKLGIPITLAALFASLAVLELQIAASRAW